jgi:hypothetical protein
VTSAEQQICRFDPLDLWPTLTDRARALDARKKISEGLDEVRPLIAEDAWQGKRNRRIELHRPSVEKGADTHH